MYARTDIDQIVALHSASWMTSTAGVDALREAHAQRQRLLLGMEGRPDPMDYAPFTVVDLTRLVDAAVNSLPHGPPAATRVSMSCALLGELLVAAGPHGDGGVFDVVPRKVDGDRHERQLPLQALRNAMFHPGSLPRSRVRSTNSGKRSHVEKLIAALENDYQAQELLATLRATPRALQSIRLAHWAILKVNALGKFELSWIVIDRMAAKKVDLGDEQRRQVRKQTSTNELEDLLRLSRSASGARKIAATLLAPPRRRG